MRLFEFHRVGSGTVKYAMVKWRGVWLFDFHAVRLGTVRHCMVLFGRVLFGKVRFGLLIFMWCGNVAVR